MRLAKRVAAVAVPVGLVVGGVAYGITRHSSKDEKTLGECTTHVGRLTVVLTDAQARNASLISAVSVQRGMPAHAATIGLATALQESKLYDLRGGDRDSLGLFQQRPSEGWGTRQQVLDPIYATNAFYDALEKVPGWETLAITKAAQDVQHSDFPGAYASYANDARALASALTGYSPAAFSCHLPAPARRATPSVRRAQGLRRALRPVFGPVSVSVGADGRLAVASGTVPRGWALASYLVAHAQTLDIGRVGYRERAWTAGSSHGWQHASSGSATDSVVID